MMSPVFFHSLQRLFQAVQPLLQNLPAGGQADPDIAFGAWAEEGLASGNHRHPEVLSGKFRKLQSAHRQSADVGEQYEGGVRFPAADPRHPADPLQGVVPLTLHVF